MSQTQGRFYKKHILAVDDTAIILMRISNTLRDKYEVITVNSGVRALKYLEEEKPDMILLDIQMPKKDGVETLREIRSMNGRENVPVIMLSSVEDKDIILQVAKLGICDYLLKPFSSEELIERIQRAFKQEEQKEKES